MSHFEVLKKLFPVKDMTGELDNDLIIEGKYLDQVDSTASQLALEIFPNTSTLLLSDWERVYDTTANGDSARQAAVTTAMKVLSNKDGRLNDNYFVSLAASLGYDSTVVEGPSMFIIADKSSQATHLPAPLYDQEQVWSWTLDSTGSTVPADRTALMTLIIEKAPAFSQVSFNFV